jgi:long-chain fatty acid transport protein
MKILRLLIAVLSVGIAGRAWAAGFALDVLSARATGMAAAVTAFIDDAQAAFYNPAGLAQGRGLDVRLGLTPIVPSFSFQSDNTGATTSAILRVTPPPHVYASYGITDQLSVGLGFYTPYGLVVPWPRGWEGNYLSIFSDLKTYYFTPEVAYRIVDRVRLGAGVQIVRATVQLKREIRLPDSSLALAELAGGTWAVGYIAGVQIDLVPSVLTFGATWRSTANGDINGRAHFSSVPPSLQNTLKDQNASTHLNLPGTIALGLAYLGVEKLKLSFEMDYYSWQVFGRLAVNFEDPSLNTLSPKNWTHTWNYHLGAEYALNSQWRLRGGLMYDPTPSPQDTISPELPDANRVNIAAGAGYQWDKFAVDAGYQLVVITHATTTLPQLPGTYSGVANLLSVTFGFHL